MFAEYKQTLRRLRGRIIGWSIGLSLYGIMMALFYDSIGQIEGMEEVLANYPEEFMAFFGNIDLITTPEGYLDTYYFSYMTMIIGIFIVGAAGGLLVGDEERGTLDLVLSHPISRSALYWARSLALLTATIIILLVSWLSWYLPSLNSSLGLTAGELLLPFIPLLAVLLLFGGLTLILSMILPSSRLAAALSAALVVGNFLLIGLANLNSDLQNVTEFTPLHYYQGGLAINGLEWGWLGGLLAFAVLFAGLGWWLFRARDIRVGGERSWKLSLPLRARRAEQA